MYWRSTPGSGFYRPIVLAVMAVLIAGGETLLAQTSGYDGAIVGAIGSEGPLRAAARRDASWVVDGPRSDQQTVRKPQPNWFVRHPVITGALIGTGAGLALSRVDSIGSLNHDPRVGLIGASVGAWGGLIASASQKKRAGQKVSTGTKIGIAAGAVSLIVLPVAACYSAGGCGGSS